MNLSGITVVSTKDKCHPCEKLIRMLNSIGTGFEVINREDEPERKIVQVPTVLKDGIRLFHGCPGSVKELRMLIREEEK